MTESLKPIRGPFPTLDSGKSTIPEEMTITDNFYNAKSLSHSITPPSKKVLSNYSTSNSSASSFLTHQTTNPTSSSSTNLFATFSASNLLNDINAISSTTTATSVSNQYSSKLKKLKSQYKKLSSELSKFNSSSGIPKANQLRLSLLSFLRSQSDEIFVDASRQHCSKCGLTGCKVLLKWWKALVESLQDQKKPVPASQKSAYFEAISRVLNRKEWKMIINNDVGDDTISELSNQYSNLLIKTLEYGINQLSNKNSSSLSLSAFVGKVFAISFFNLEGASNALLFLLNVRISSIVTNYELFFKDPENNEKIGALCDEINGIKNRFSNSVKYMVDIDRLTYGMKIEKGKYKLSKYPFPKPNNIKRESGFNFVKLDFNNSNNLLLQSPPPSSFPSSSPSSPNETAEKTTNDCEKPTSKNSGLLPAYNIQNPQPKSPEISPDLSIKESPVFKSPSNNLGQSPAPPPAPSYPRRSRFQRPIASKKKFDFNGIQPPKAPVSGINDPQGPWVRKWSGINSDVFISFLRHYLTCISDSLVENDDSVTTQGSNINLKLMNFLNADHLNDLNCLIASPGFIIVWSHVYDIINWTIKANAAKNANINGNTKKNRDSVSSSSSFKSNGSTLWGQKFNTSANNPFGSNHNMTLSFFSLSSLTSLSNSNDSRKSTTLHPMAKVFQILRDFLYNPKSNNEKLISGPIITNFDNLLVKYANDISAYDFTKAGLILDLAQEFITQVCSCPSPEYDGSMHTYTSLAPESNQSNNFSDNVTEKLHLLNSNNSYLKSLQFAKSINWKFWLNACQNMLMTENINSQLKALSFLFNIWDFVPDDNLRGNYSPNNDPNEFFNKNLKYNSSWIKNPDCSIKYNLACWLISSKNWLKFFCHWLPLVRSYYLRLIVWRLLSKNLTPTSIMQSDLENVNGINQHQSYVSLYSQNGICFNPRNSNTKSRSVSNQILNNNLNGSFINKEKIKKIITDRLSFSYEKIIKISQFSSSGYYMMPDMNGSCPIVNRKFAITPINFKSTNENLFIDPNVNHINDAYNNSIDSENEIDGPRINNNKSKNDCDNANENNNSSSSEEYNLLNGLVPTVFSNQSQVRKINPFEIFDDAVYSSTAYALMIKNDNGGPSNGTANANLISSDATESTAKSSSSSIIKSQSSGSLSRAFSIKSNKSKSFTTLNRANASIYGKESLNQAATANNNSVSNNNNGGKLFGFMKLFKKSKSSTNIAVEGERLGKTFNNYGEEFPELPKSLNIKVEKEEEEVKVSNNKTLETISVSTEAEIISINKKQKRESSLANQKRSSLIASSKSLKDLSKVNDKKLNDLPKKIISVTPSAQSSVSSKDYFSDNDDETDDTSSMASSSKPIKHKASMKSLSNLTNSKSSNLIKKHGLSSTSLKSMSSSITHTNHHGHGNNHNEKSPKQTGLESLPLPPELKTKVPEIQRQVFKFSLIWNQDSFNYQLYVINNLHYRSFHDPNSYATFNHNNKFPNYPTLPFSESMGIGYMPTDEDYTHTTEIENYESEDDNDDDEGNLSLNFKNRFEETSRNNSVVIGENDNSNGQLSRKMSTSTFFTCNTELSPLVEQSTNNFDYIINKPGGNSMKTPTSPTFIINNNCPRSSGSNVDSSVFNHNSVATTITVDQINSPELSQPVHSVAPKLSTYSSSSSSSSNVERKTQKLIKERQRALNLLKKWGTVGKALNEWNDIVEEYEDFIRSRRVVLENQRIMNLHNTQDDYLNEYQTINFVPLLIAEAPAPKINAS